MVISPADGLCLLLPQGAAGHGTLITSVPSWTQSLSSNRLRTQPPTSKWSRSNFPAMVLWLWLVSRVKAYRASSGTGPLLNAPLGMKGCVRTNSEASVTGFSQCPKAGWQPWPHASSLSSRSSGLQEQVGKLVSSSDYFGENGNGPPNLLPKAYSRVSRIEVSPRTEPNLAAAEPLCTSTAFRTTTAGGLRGGPYSVSGEQDRQEEQQSRLHRCSFSPYADFLGPTSRSSRALTAPHYREFPVA